MVHFLLPMCVKKVYSLLILLDFGCLRDLALSLLGGVMGWSLGREKMYCSNSEYETGTHKEPGSVAKPLDWVSRAT